MRSAVTFAVGAVSVAVKSLLFKKKRGDRGLALNGTDKTWTSST